jgi:hypothetical protein
MVGILERLGLQQPQVTQKMVSKAKQRADAAIDALETFAADDPLAAQAKVGLEQRSNNVNGSLTQQHADLNTIKDDAERELKTARQREIEALASTPDGRDRLDQRVGALGGKATSQEQKDFVKAALLARYDINTMEGDLSTKALPKLYAVLGMVPESHVRDNDMLKNIIRLKQGTEGASHYSPDADNAKNRPGKRIYLELGRTGTFAITSETWTGDTIGKTKVNEFSATTLHEVGHAVDEKRHFMDGKTGQGAYGGWVESSKEDVARLIAAQEGFYTGWEHDYSKAALAKTLEGVLVNGKFERTETDVFCALAATPPTAQTLLNDPGVVQAQTDYDNFTQNGWPQDIKTPRETARGLCKVKPTFVRDAIVEEVIKRVYSHRVDPAVAVNEFLQDFGKAAQKPTNNDWPKMKAHTAVKFCLAVRVTGENNGLWDQGASGAGKYSIGNKVYQESSRGKWICYDTNARTRAVSTYQFRAPAEWFAELYSLYYIEKQKNGGTAPTSHTDFTWIAQEIDN